MQPEIQTLNRLWATWIVSIKTCFYLALFQLNNFIGKKANNLVCLYRQNKIQFCVQYLVCIVFITLLYVRPTLILQGVPAISTQFRSQFLTFLIVLSKETRFAIKTQMVKLKFCHLDIYKISKQISHVKKVAMYVFF